MSDAIDDIDRLKLLSASTPHGATQAARIAALAAESLAGLVEVLDHEAVINSAAHPGREKRSLLSTFFEATAQVYHHMQVDGMGLAGALHDQEAVLRLER